MPTSKLLASVTGLLAAIGTVGASLAQTPTPTKEYIRLGRRIIAIEQPGTSTPPSVSPQSPVFPSAATQGALNVSYSGTWTSQVQSGSAWIQSLAISGNTITYSVTQNTSSQARYGAIVVCFGSTQCPGSAGDISINVTQNGVNSSISFTPASETVPSAASSAVCILQSPPTYCTFAVATSGTWTVTTANPDWITLTTTSGANNANVSFTYAANTGSSSRQGSITVTSQSGSNSFILSQEQGITLTPSSVSFAATDQGQMSFSISAAADQSWSVTNNASSWVSMPPTAGTGPATVSYTIGPNTTPYQLSGNLTVNALFNGSIVAYTTLQLSQGAGPLYSSICITSSQPWPAFGNPGTIGTAINPVTAGSTVTFHAYGNAQVVVDSKNGNSCTAGPIIDSSVTWPSLPSGGALGTMTGNVYQAPNGQTQYPFTLGFNAIYAGLGSNIIYADISGTVPAVSYQSWPFSAGQNADLNFYFAGSGWPMWPFRSFTPLEILIGAPTTSNEPTMDANTNSLTSAQNACYMDWWWNTGRFTLSPDSGASQEASNITVYYNGNDPPNQPNISNDQCTVVASGTAAITDGSDEWLYLTLSFTPRFGGTQNVWIRYCTRFPYGLPLNSTTCDSTSTAADPTTWLFLGTLDIPGYQPPTVGIIAPSGASGTLAIQGYAFDNAIQAESAISNVDIYVDGTKVSPHATLGILSPAGTPSTCVAPIPGCPNAAGFTYSWDTTQVTNGQHTITAVATDSDSVFPRTATQTPINHTSTSPGLIVTVNNGLTLSLSPNSTTVLEGQSITITAAEGTNQHPSVSWISSLANAITVNANGYSAIFTAPNSGTTVTITAESTVDGNISQAVTFTVLPISVSLVPASVSLIGGQTQQFSASVSNASNTNVSWSLSGPGTLSSSGLYTAPSIITGSQQATVTAKSLQDNTTTGQATITLNPVTLSLQPSQVTLYPGQTVTFNATVGYSGNSGVNWTVPQNPQMPGSWTSTSVSLTYTAPSVFTSGGPWQIQATSQADSSKVGTATIQLVSAPVTATSLQPSSGTTTSGTFTATFSDTFGNVDITAVQMVVGSSSTSTAASCYLQYLPGSSTLSLADDSGASWSAPVILGTANSIVSNSQCSINVGGASASLPQNSNTLTLTIPITFSPSFSLPSPNSQSIYLYAADSVTSNGWQQMGSWTVPPLAPVSVSPSSGTSGYQPFTAVYTDTTNAGTSEISNVGLLIDLNSNNAAYTHACYVLYNKSSGLLYLRDDLAQTWLGPLTPGQPGTAANSQCTISSAGASVTLSGNNGHGYHNTLTLVVPVAFSATFAGPATLFMNMAATSGASGLVTMGTLTIPTLSVSPPFGSGDGPQSIVATYTDANGATDLKFVDLLVSPSPTTTTSACWVHYDLGSNTLWLRTDDGSGWTQSSPIHPLGSRTLSNTQCTLYGSSSNYSSVGNTLTLTLDLSFNHSFAGSQEVSLSSTTNGLQSTGNVLVGTWGVQ